MKFLNFACAVDETVCVVPSFIWVTAFPFSQVLKHAISDSAGDDTGHVVFWLSVDDGWWWRGFNLTWQWVHCCFVKPVSTENVTHLHVLQEI